MILFWILFVKYDLLIMMIENVKDWVYVLRRSVDFIISGSFNLEIIIWCVFIGWFGLSVCVKYFVVIEFLFWYVLENNLVFKIICGFLE